MKSSLVPISIVDDDESVRESLPELLRECGFHVQSFASAQAFLGSTWVGETHCLLLDVAMPGMTGPELQRELRARGLAIPIIFITAHRDEDVRARLIRDGATDCLYKPFSEFALLDAIRRALDRR